MAVFNLNPAHLRADSSLNSSPTSSRSYSRSIHLSPVMASSLVIGAQPHRCPFQTTLGDAFLHGANYLSPGVSSPRSDRIILSMMPSTPHNSYLFLTPPSIATTHYTSAHPPSTSHTHNHLDTLPPLPSSTLIPPPPPLHHPILPPATFLSFPT
ncbi:hypothetical protein D9619_009856 [Psilocybe cf. subviscida]|uniref:Uncharacterized protein n=1 Tax=Psilocybe cf. subviscida TaxID=2480587 RepID=A0A8H5BLS5_9AGAR|nr:hypothetical protein D9619_009856 [Psilocybe cf. subviscida]